MACLCEGTYLCPVHSGDRLTTDASKSFTGVSIKDGDRFTMSGQPGIFEAVSPSRFERLGNRKERRANAAKERRR